MNIMLVILFIALSIFFIFVSQYLFEKNGIINIYLIYNIMSFLLSFKIFEMLKININANIIISALFTSLTYLIIEKTTAKEYKNIIKQTLTLNVILSIIILIVSIYISSINDTNAVNIKNIFIDNYKILIGFPIVTLINQVLILLIYNSIKETYNNQNLIIILTNLTILMIESLLFVISSYIFTLNIKTILILVISNYLIKVVITSIYTPFISYLIKLKKVKL